MDSAIIYIRVSTEDQNLGVEVQRQQVEAYARLRGYSISEVIIDKGVSGTVPFSERPGGARVARAVEARSVKHVLALKLDRLFRDCSDCLKTTTEWEQHGVAFHLIDLGGQALDITSPIGRFFLTVMAAAAELERNMIADRIKSALGVLKGKKKRYCKNTPWGFRLVDSDIVEDPREQEIAALTRELKRDGLGYRRIAAELNRRGFRSRAGKEFVEIQVARILRAA